MVPAAERAEAASTMTCPGAPGPIGPGTAGSPADGFTPLTPVRLLDTRFGTGGVDQRPDANCVVRIDVAPVVGSSATAVALSVLAVDADRRGFLTAYPCGSLRPPTSNVNPRAGVPTPNLAIVTLDTTREVCVYTNVATHLVVDATGWFGPGGARFNDQAPQRVLDTRDELAPLPATTVRKVRLGGPIVPAGADGVAVNITVSEPDADGWILAYPCTTDLPLASTVNYLAGEDRAGITMVGLDAAGDLCLYSLRTTQVIVDLQGWYGGSGDGSIEPLVGARVVDSRDGTGGWSGPMGPGEVRSFDPYAGGKVPDNSYAVALNVIATEAQSAGHLRVYPCGATMPNVSAVNFLPGDEATNMVVTSIGDDGLVCVFASTPTHVVVDAFAAATAPGLVQSLAISTFATFDRDISDYAQRCTADPTSVNLTVEGLPRTTVRVDGVSVGRGTTVSKGLGPDDALTVTVTRDDEMVEYWWRCLPADFPVTGWSAPGEPNTGWYLVTFGGLGGPGPTPYVAILDTNGTPVWYKRTDRTPLDLKVLSDGTLAWTPLLGAAYGVHPTHGYEVHTLDGSLVDTVASVDSPSDHHELLELANGNWLIVTYRVRLDTVDLTAIGGGAAETVVDSVLQEVDAQGNLVWEWDSKDHLAVTETTTIFRVGANSVPGAGDLVDLVHVNSVDELPDGDLLVSGRHLDAVFRVDRSTGDIEWKLGGTNAGDNPDGAVALTIVDDPLNGTIHAHDARVLDADTITVFDNRSGNGVGQPARAVRYDIDEGTSTARLTSELRNPRGRSSGGLGSFQVLPDGHWLINWGSVPNDGRMVEEFTDSGQLVVALDHAGQSYRTTKVPLDALDIDELRANAGGLAEAQPPPP